MLALSLLQRQLAALRVHTLFASIHVCKKWWRKKQHSVPGVCGPQSSGGRGMVRLLVDGLWYKSDVLRRGRCTNSIRNHLDAAARAPGHQSFVKRERTLLQRKAKQWAPVHQLRMFGKGACV